jgi:hypothetical protein
MSCADSRGRIDGAKRQCMTSVGEVTVEEGREKFYVHPAGIEPATSRLCDEDGTSRPNQTREQGANGLKQTEHTQTGTIRVVRRSHNF